MFANYFANSSNAKTEKILANEFRWSSLTAVAEEWINLTELILRSRQESLEEVPLC